MRRSPARQAYQQARRESSPGPAPPSAPERPKPAEQPRPAPALPDSGRFPAGRLIGFALRPNNYRGGGGVLYFVEPAGNRLCLPCLTCQYARGLPIDEATVPVKEVADTDFSTKAPARKYPCTGSVSLYPPTLRRLCGFQPHCDACKGSISLHPRYPISADTPISLSANSRAPLRRRCRRHPAPAVLGCRQPDLPAGGIAP